MSKLHQKIFIHEKMEMVVDWLILRMLWIEWSSAEKAIIVVSKLI